MIPFLGDMNESMINELISHAAKGVDQSHADLFQSAVVEQVSLLRRTLSHNLLDSFSNNQDVPRKVNFTAPWEFFRKNWPFEKILRFIPDLKKILKFQNRTKWRVKMWL